MNLDLSKLPVETMNDLVAARKFYGDTFETIILRYITEGLQHEKENDLGAWSEFEEEDNETIC